MALMLSNRYLCDERKLLESCIALVTAEMSCWTARVIWLRSLQPDVEQAAFPAVTREVRLTALERAVVSTQHVIVSVYLDAHWN
jgi:hypothetical protein